MASELLQKQWRFSRMVADLLHFAHARGYEVTGGEWWRPKETAELYAEQGRGIANSKHCERLAIDLNLFCEGRYLTSTEDYTELGLHWEKLGGVWGGRFSRADGNHFEL